jgi:DNA-binding CsgD family transcriptional regulator
MDEKKTPQSRISRQGDARAMIRLIERLNSFDSSRMISVEMKRQMVADWCRLLGERMNRPGVKTPSSSVIQATIHSQPVPPSPVKVTGPSIKLAPRVRQTLERLLAGDSEKQIARYLQLSPHTVHVYIKAIYRSYDVSSRGELFSHFVDPIHRSSALSEKIP